MRVFSKDNPINRPPCGVLASVITGDLRASVDVYENLLGYKLIEYSDISSELATHWGEPRLANCKSAILGPASGAEIYIRFLEVRDAAPVEPGAGWFALELCVKDVEQLYDQFLKSGQFKPFAPPKPLTFTDKVYPMQCRGPSGEIIYFNQTKGNLPEVDLPIAKSAVDHLFITILTASDIDRSIEFFANLLNMDVLENHEIPYKTLNRTFELPLEQTHKLTTLGRGRRVSLEINQCPVSKPAQQSLTKGIWMMSFSVDTVEEGLKVYKTKAGYQSFIKSGPDGEKIELIIV